MSTCSNVIELSSEDEHSNDPSSQDINFRAATTNIKPPSPIPVSEYTATSSIITKTKRKVTKKKLTKEKLAVKERNKQYKPGECLKHTIIEMHPHLLGMWYCADVVHEASAVGLRVQPSPGLCDQSLVLFARRQQPILTTADNGMVGLSAADIRCEHGLYVRSAEEVAELVHKHTLAQELRTASKFAGCSLTLVVFGVKDYFKSSGRKTINSSRKLMTELDLEMAITDLLAGGYDAQVADSANELALAVVQTAKAVAEAPFKKAKRAMDEKAAFYMRGDNRKCVAVDKDGNGAGRLWQQMVGVLPLSSLEAARALCARYTSPRQLYEVFQSAEGVAEVAEINVLRAAAPSCKARRLGPELARKLHTLFTAVDGDTLLD